MTQPDQHSTFFHLQRVWTKIPITLRFAVVLFGWMFFLHLHPYVKKFQQDSESLVVESVQYAVKEGDIFFRGGFMIMNERYVEMAKEGAKAKGHDDDETETADNTYYSQSGLQFRFFAAIPVLLKSAGPLWLIGAKAFNVAMFSLLLGWSGTWLAKRYTPVAGWLFILQVMGSVTLIRFSGNLYWMGWLLFLPFVTVLNLYPSMRNGWRWSALLLTTGLMISIKSLCGYEYLSCVLLSATVPIFFYECRDGKLGWLPLWRSFQVCVVGTLGFAAAAFIHLRQAAKLTGSWGTGWNALRERIHARTVGDHFQEPVSLKLNLYHYFQYIPENGHSWLFVNLAVLLLLLWFGREESTRSERMGWTLALGVALVSSLSWNTLALGHMRYHGHINQITFFVCFALVLFLLNAKLLSAALNPTKQHSKASLDEVRR